MTLSGFGQGLQRPNFVLFIVDDIGWNDLGCYGNSVVKTPHLDQLANEGLLFQNAYLTTSSCSPSRCSIITGRYPHNTGAPELHDPLPAGQVMFPQLLKEAGYYTVLSGKNHMGPQTKLAFDTISRGKGPGGEEDWVSFIENRPKDQPFFFWFASHDAHRDWQFDTKGFMYHADSLIVPPMLYDGPLTRKDLRGYYHEISRCDYYMGQLINALKEDGILQNTYIIFMSDNGRPFPRSKARLYDSGVKTPLIIYGPNVRAGTTEALISSIDLAPTLLELANVNKSNTFQGVSFLPLLERKIESTRDFAFAEHNWHVFKSHERMVRYGDWMYIKNMYPEKRNLSAESSKMFPAGAELWEAHAKSLTTRWQDDVFLLPRPTEELYNVKTDPYQFKNLAAEKNSREILLFLRAVLDIWIYETGDSVPLHPTADRDDINGNRISGWKKGEKPGASRRAANINRPGPVNCDAVQLTKLTPQRE